MYNGGLSSWVCSILGQYHYTFLLTAAGADKAILHAGNGLRNWEVV